MLDLQSLSFTKIRKLNLNHSLQKRRRNTIPNLIDLFIHVNCKISKFESPWMTLIPTVNVHRAEFQNQCCVLRELWG